MQPEALFPVPPDPRILEFDARLERFFGKPAPRDVWNPLDQFIYSLLSSRTKTEQSHQVMRDLRARFGTWENLRDASVPEIEQAIQIVTFPETKAPWLKIALMQITARYGSLTLDFLASYRTDKIRSWLEQFEGVGPKTSAAVVNFSTLRRRALCVDSHHLRVVQRLNLTPRADAATTEERLMRRIPAEWDAIKLDEHHSLVKKLGQEICTFNDPLCARCPLLDMCPTGKKNVAEKQA
jgi:endonuclease-3